MNVCAEMFGASTRTRKGIPNNTECRIVTSRSARSQLLPGACRQRFPGVGPACSRCSRDLSALLAICFPAGRRNLSLFSFKNSSNAIPFVARTVVKLLHVLSLKPKLHVTVRKRLRRPCLYRSRALLEQWKGPHQPLCNAGGRSGPFQILEGKLRSYCLLGS